MLLAELKKSNVCKLARRIAFLRNDKHRINIDVRKQNVVIHEFVGTALLLIRKYIIKHNFDKRHYHV